MEIKLREATSSKERHAKTRDLRIQKKQFLMFHDEIKYLKSVNGIELNLVDRIVYSQLMDDAPFYIKERGYYSPPMETLAFIVGVSHSKIKRVIKKLIECGLVIILNSKLGCTNELGVVRTDGVVIQPKKGIQERMKQVDNHKDKPKNEIDNDW